MLWCQLDNIIKVIIKLLKRIEEFTETGFHVFTRLHLTVKHYSITQHTVHIATTVHLYCTNCYNCYNCCCNLHTELAAD